MESTLTIPNVDISLVRRYSLAELDAIDFSTSDDFAIVVENLKNVITLGKNIEEFWTEDHEQSLWQFVIDSESYVLTAYYSQTVLTVECDIPSVPTSELFYIVRVSPEKLFSTDYEKKLFYGTAKAPFFESLYETLCMVYEPMFSESSEWSKCIKSDYMHHLSKFLLELFDMRNKLREEMVLYVPAGIENKDVKSIIEQKELLNQVERAVMKWIWLFMCILMKRGTDTIEDSGPLDEIQFWEEKSADLEKVLYQLERDDVKMGIEVMKTAKLVSYSKFIEVYNQLKIESGVAKSNVKFLSILKKPCKDIETTLLSDIPKFLDELLDLVRIIYNNSSYFKHNKEISNLLSKVNNFIIKIISSHVSLGEIFNSKSSEQKQNLLDVISCCNKWLEIFDFSEKVHKKFAAIVWSVKPVSPLVNLFIHRCEEFIQICEFKEEFCCEEDMEVYAPGHKCFEISEQLKTIESSFWVSLQKLGENKYAALQIRKTVWYDFFKKFKEEMYELEVTISKLMINSFENLNTIEEGILILTMFQKYFEKQVIKRDLRKCIKSLYDIFFNELNFVKKELIELKSSDIPLLPMFGGTAYCVSLLPQRGKQLYKILQEESHLWPREYDIDIKHYYQDILDSIGESIHTLFLQWTKTIPKDPYGWLNEPIIIKNEDSAFLQLNLNSNTQNLIQELYYWDKTGVEIPQQVVHLHEKNDIFLKRIMKMSEGVSNYNRLIKNLSEDGEIFSDMLSSMEDSIKSVIDNLTWAVPSSSAKSALKTISEQTKLAKETFSQCETNKMKIKKQNKEISKKSLISTNITSPLSYTDFIQMQVSWKQQVLEEIAELLKAEIHEANQVCNVFKTRKFETDNMCSAFLKKFIGSVCSALVECYATSLKSTATLFGVNRRNKIRVILKMSLTLKNHQLCYVPDFKKLCTSIVSLNDDIEIALSSFMIFEGLMPGDFDEQNHFLDNVKKSGIIQELKKEIDIGLYLLYEAEKSYNSEWNPCSSLWETSKSDLLQKYKETGWNAEDFERDINHFLNLGQKVLLYSRYKSLEFCIVDCQCLKDSAAVCVEDWKNELGSNLSKISCSNLQNAFDLFELTASKFKDYPGNLEQLKQSINFLINAKNYMKKIEYTFGVIQGNFDVLKRLEIPISEKALEQQEKLISKWKELEMNFENYYVTLQKIQALHRRHFLEYHKELENHVNILEKELYQEGPFQLIHGYPNALNLMSHYKNILVQLQKTETRMQRDDGFFHLNIKSLEKFSSIDKDLNDLRLSWTYVKQLDDYLDEWGNIPVMHFDVKDKKLLSDHLQSNVQDLDQSVKGTHWVLLQELLSNLNNLNEYYGMMSNFQQDKFQERHWIDFKEVLGLTCDDSEVFFKSSEFTFAFLRKVEIKNLAWNINMIAVKAIEEYKIEQSLKKVELTWEGECFIMSDNKKFYEVKDTESLVSIIEEHQGTLGIIKASKYCSYFSADIDSLENSLLLMLDVIKQLDYFQSTFCLLENIFAEQSVQAQLPKESKEVQDVTVMWKDVTTMMYTERIVWKISHEPDFLNRLISMNKELESVQHSLESYLDTKRRAFPRFYFISNDDLLSIIGKKSPDAIQPHLKKCFDSINKLKIIEKVEEKWFQREHTVTILATGMYSELNEFVEFNSPVVLEGPVESWLLEVEEMMQTTLHATLLKCLQMLFSILTKEDFDFDNVKWLSSWSDQICVLSTLIAWTAETTNSIKIVQETAITTALKNLRKKWRRILKQITQKLQYETQVVMQKKTMMMIIILVHSCEVVESLIKYVCNDVEAFEWQVHLRYYIDEEQDVCLIRQTKAVFKYGFEYLGNRERLVITPLTNRCYLSFTTALYLNQGVTLRGCRSSGKTETLKDLGVALGNFVLVINCSENLKHGSLVRMLSGLAQIGAWGLLEDFNRVKLEIVSFLSQQISSILQALAEKRQVFTFFGNDIPLKEGCGIFCSINPEYPSANYDCFSSFRPVTIISPDTFTIIQVYLFAYGFKDAKALATDIQLLYTMAKELLSKGQHYDFGLRAIVRFLKYLNTQKRIHTKLNEIEIIILCLKSTTMPSLDIFDVPIFEGILESIFGFIRRLDDDDTKFSEEIKRTLQSKSFQPDISMINKINQLHEIKKYCHAIILLGESRSGKTTSWKMLKETYSHLHQDSKSTFSSVNVYMLNPKAYTLNELYGYFTDTGVWKNGLFPSLLKEASNNTKAKERWILLNGPVDIEWLGSVSSLLDNNKVLTLANGERIMLLSEVTLIFETTNLIHCSPSIVSCCGIIYHESSSGHWKFYLKSWIQDLENNTARKVVGDLIDKHFNHILEYSLKYLQSFKSVSTTLLNHTMSFTRIMDSFLRKVSKAKIPSARLSRMFWMSVVWSVGAVLDEKDRLLFDMNLKKLDASLVKLSNVYEYGLDTDFEWIRWSTHLQNKWEPNPGVPFEDILVPTESTLSYQSMIETLIEEMKPIMLIGKSGSGKTIIVNNLLCNIHSDSCMHTLVNITPQTTSLKLQHILEVKLDNKAGGLLLPQSGKKMIAFLDDFHMGKCDQFGSQSALEFLYMTIDDEFWYNRDKWKLNHIQNICYLAAGNSTSDYCNKIPKPLLNRFSIINVLSPQEPQMAHIFNTLLKDKIYKSSKEVNQVLNCISLGSVSTYKAVRDAFLPIPSKLHYLFGLRDIKKVLCRILDINHEVFNDKLAVTKSWFHECVREFSDRFTCVEDQKIFSEVLANVIEKDFLIQLNEIQMNSMKYEMKFVKFLDVDGGYEEVKDYSILLKYFEKCVEEYRKSQLDFSVPMILFEGNIEHLCRIIRGIEIPHGNMILLGATGTGKRSLCRIASFILKYEVFEITLEENYGVSAFKRDLHKLLYDAGVKGTKILFLMSDDQLVDDIFLHYLSEVLILGVPFDVFTQNELKKMYSEVSSGLEIPLENTECHDLLVKNIKCNLHLIFCISYNSVSYKKCFLNYLSLYKSCTINWFDEWPYEALKSVACKFLHDVDLNPSDLNRSEACFQILPEMHITTLEYFKQLNSSHLVFETSSTFIKFLNTFKKVLVKKQDTVEQALDRLVFGLQKISETQEKVNEIARETKEARKKLIIAERECDEALQDIQQKKISLAQKQETIQEKKAEIEKKEEVCKRITIAAKEDLNFALPALDEAREALKALNKRDIGEIKSYAKPPVLVEIVLEAVMILRESEPTWAEAKRQLGNPSFLKELFEYDGDNISDSALDKVEKYIERAEFQPNQVGKVSLAAKSLCIWVRAMHVYGNIYKKIKPKKERLRIAQEELEELQNTLADLQHELEVLEASILHLEQEHKLLIQKKEEYAIKEKELALKLERAESIIDGLSSEKKRWQLKVSSLKKKKIFVVGDSLLASGYLTYLGPRDQSHRTYMRRLWEKKISETMFESNPEFDLADFFVEETVKNEWKICGLPTDQYSQEGAAIVTESPYCPFIIDPERQASKWIKNMGEKQGLKCVDIQDLKCTSILEAGRTEGFPVLLQNVNPQLDTSLMTLPMKLYNHTSLPFNKKELQIHPPFKLYMSTNLLNPQFTSTVIYETCIVNFTIKEKGLEDQLLPLVVKNESSDLETKKESSVTSIRKCKRILSKEEDTMLELLRNSQGSLLEDEKLVQALKKSKSSSIEIEDKLSSFEKSEAIIDSARDKYRPCCKIASILYFVLTDMTYVDSIYVFTLDSYIELFLNSISKSPRDSDISRRILKLNSYHQHAVYSFACRTVLQKHSLLLAFHICTRILLEEGKLDKAEYKFFITGGQVTNRTDVPPNPCLQWLPQECWDNITQLEHLPKFLSVTISFDENSRLWQDWYLTLEPEKKPLPGIWRNICSGFHLLLIVRCLRLDRITSCIMNFVNNTLGKSYLEYPIADIKELFHESSATKPFVLFTASSDIDPEKIISSLAKSFEMEYHAVSLGTGQEIVASQLLIESARLGLWAFISNCHLLLSWLPVLEKFVNKLQTTKVHENFRLWLGSSPNKLFPASVLQNSIILSLDSPKDIRASMVKLHDEFVTEEEIETSASQPKYKSLLFSLSFFHSILIGREKFQNLGWNCIYNFTNQDFKISMKMLKLYLDEYSDTEWDSLKQMISEVIYGGHVADKIDERLLMTYYDQFFCDEVLANVKYRLSSVDAYYVPNDGPLEEYVSFVKELPYTDVPEVFGQHRNAEIPSRIQDATEMLNNMSKIKRDFFSEKCNEDQVSIIVSDIKIQIPDFIDEIAGMDILHENPDPYNKILIQEIRCYNTLLKLVLQSLNELEEGINGKKIMNEELSELSIIIQKMEVPKQWQKMYPSLKPLGSWIQDLKLRVQQFTDWISSGSMPIKLWLPGFTAPTSVLFATLQKYCKDNDVILKELLWEYHVSALDESHITEAPLEGIYIRGLFLEGAGWDKTNSILIEPEPLHLITRMPVIHFKPVIESSIRGVYSCPCYYTSKRTDEKGNPLLLFSVDLKTKKGKEHWIKRGTSLILSSK